MFVIDRRAERTTNGVAFLMTAATLLALTAIHPKLAPPPPPPPPQKMVEVSLVEPPPPPAAPPVVQPPPPPPPVKATTPIIPAPRPIPRPRPLIQPPKPIEQPVVTAPPPPIPMPPVHTVASPTPPPPSISVEVEFTGVLRAYFKSITRYPSDREARLHRLQGSAEVHFTMSRSGEISNVEITRSSGASVLDRQAYSTVLGGTPPAIPDKAWAGESTHPFVVTIEFVSPT